MRVSAMVILSVRLSITTRYQSKTRRDRDFRFSLYDSLESLVFRDNKQFTCYCMGPSFLEGGPIVYRCCPSVCPVPTFFTYRFRYV